MKDEKIHFGEIVMWVLSALYTLSTDENPDKYYTADEIYKSWFSKRKDVTLEDIQHVFLSLTKTMFLYQENGSDGSIKYKWANGSL